MTNFDVDVQTAIRLLKEVYGVDIGKPVIEHDLTEDELGEVNQLLAIVNKA